MKDSYSLLKRKSCLINDVRSPPSKCTRCSLEDTLLDKMKLPEDDSTREEKNYNNENDNDHDKSERAHEDSDFGNDEAKYLLGDEGPTGKEENILEEGLERNDGDNKENEGCTRNFRHGYYLVEGKLPHGMEDYVFAKRKNINGYDLGLYAIYDGHAGRDVAKYLQKHLFPNILNQPDFWENPVRAVKRACKVTDDEILEKITDWCGGSTAVAAILINGEKLLVAKVGDSRAISCRDGVAKQITIDHEPEREKELVESRGGFVLKRPGSIPRVDDQLAMSRAFGDGKLKEHITAEPDVMVQTIHDDTDFIVLASDGLWKVMTNQEACDCIKDVDDAKKASKKLIKEALSKGSYDDISCIVVMF